MLLGGDEIGRTQAGNNNGWCQDNEISWYDWENADEDLLAFVRALIRLRHEQPVFRRQDFLVGDEVNGSGLARRSVGAPGRRGDGPKATGSRDDARALGAFLNGERSPTTTAAARRSRAPHSCCSSTRVTSR